MKDWSVVCAVGKVKAPALAEKAKSSSLHLCASLLTDQFPMKQRPTIAILLCRTEFIRSRTYWG